ncbi:MAG: hypothetical protein MJ230_04480 [bacterium]|nr:hypothetical protein [bacterium]
MSNCNNHNGSNSIYVSGSETRGAIQASNNKARYYAELAEQYKNEAKELRDDAQYYAEQNSDVTKTYVDGIDSALRNLIATKQNSGNYALEDELPTKLSELQNDTSFVNSTALQNAVDSVLPSTSGKVGVLSFDGNDIDWKDINGLNLFDLVQKDHTLSYGVDLEGFAPLGEYVYKEASVGTRYGYPDFYAKVIEEYNNADDIETVSGVTIKVHSNGHKFYNISDKSAIDGVYNTLGIAWFYGVDTVNERIFLPRNKYLSIKFNSTAPVKGNGMTLGLTNGTQNGGFTYANLGGVYGVYPGQAIYGTPVGSSDSNPAMSTGASIGVTTDSAKSGIIADLSVSLQQDTTYNWYIVVGNVKTIYGYDEIVAEGTEILTQVNQGLVSKLDLNGTNISNAGNNLINEVINWGMPDYSAGVSFADGSTFNQNGWLFVYAPYVISGDRYVYIDGVLVYRKYDTDYLNGYHKVSDSDWIPYPKNGVITVTSTFDNLIFYPSKGAN